MVQVFFHPVQPSILMQCVKRECTLLKHSAFRVVWLRRSRKITKRHYKIVKNCFFYSRFLKNGVELSQVVFRLHVRDIVATDVWIPILIVY